MSDDLKWFSLGSASSSSDGQSPVSGIMAPPRIDATPFKWIEPSTIAPRSWLYGNHLARKYVSATIAPGGAGKSTLGVSEAIAMAAGRDLLGDKPHGALKVWLINLEDPHEEIERRVVAAMLEHRVSPAHIGDRLFINSGREMPLRLADLAGGKPTLLVDAFAAFERTIKINEIDVVLIDPLVSLHGLDENANGAMDMLVKRLAKSADDCNCAIELVHHVRKLNGQDADADSARGGSAIISAVRSARVLNGLSAEVAKTWDIHEADRRGFVRRDSAKANLAPPSKARWFRLASVDLANATAERQSDQVAVAVSWSPPDLMEGITVAKLSAVQHAVHGKNYRASPLAQEWVGYAIADLLSIDAASSAGKAKLKAALKAWMASGALVTSELHDARNGRPSPVVDVGEWVTP